MTPAPRAWHQEVAGRLYRVLSSYLEREPVGRAFSSPADISFAPDTLVQPDVFVVPLDEARARADRFTKRRWCQENDVLLYWMVDADDGAVEVWTPAAQFPAMERERLLWEPAGSRQPFVLELAELLRPI